MFKQKLWALLRVVSLTHLFITNAFNMVIFDNVEIVNFTFSTIPIRKSKKSKANRKDKAVSYLQKLYNNDNV